MSPSYRRAPALAAVRRHLLLIGALAVTAGVVAAVVAPDETVRYRATAVIQAESAAAHPRLVELGVLPARSAAEAARSVARLSPRSRASGVAVTSEGAHVVIAADARTPGEAAGRARAAATALLADRNSQYARAFAGAEARVEEQLGRRTGRFDAPETAVLEQALADLGALAGTPDPSVRMASASGAVQLGSGRPDRVLIALLAGLAALLAAAAAAIGFEAVPPRLSNRRVLARPRRFAAALVHGLVERAARPRLALAGALATGLRQGSERGSLTLGPTPAADDEPDGGDAGVAAPLSAELVAVRKLEQRLRELEAEASEWAEPTAEPTSSPVAAVPPRARARDLGRARRHARRLSVVLMVLGAVLVTYSATIVVWRDPVTDLYARWQQYRLEAKLEESFRAFQIAAPAGGEPSVPRNPARPPSPAELAASRRSVAAAARRVGAGLERSDPLGRIVIAKLDIDPVFVHGTRWRSDLSKGPGHYEQTALPGLGKTVAIAGHRTTFGAPFRHIDRLEARDEIVLETVYATFRYRVVSHEIVNDDDWTIIRPRRLETLVLSACHPLFRASHRWIVYARLAEVRPTRGVPYRLDSDGRLLASGPARR